jgi:hypothetical protein
MTKGTAERERCSAPHAVHTACSLSAAVASRRRGVSKKGDDAVAARRAAPARRLSVARTAPHRGGGIGIGATAQHAAAAAPPQLQCLVVVSLPITPTGVAARVATAVGTAIWYK